MVPMVRSLELRPHNSPLNGCSFIWHSVEGISECLLLMYINFFPNRSQQIINLHAKIKPAKFATGGVDSLKTSLTAVSFLFSKMTCIIMARAELCWRPRRSCSTSRSFSSLKPALKLEMMSSSVLLQAGLKKSRSRPLQGESQLKQTFDSYLWPLSLCNARN